MSDIITVDFKPCSTKPTTEKILKKESIFQQECQHNKGFTLAEGENTVRCGVCDKVLDPIWVFGQLMKTESSWHRQYLRLVEFNELYKKNSKFKCDHCGKMSRTVKRIEP